MGELFSKDAEIEVWWHRQCKKCRYRAELKNGVTTDGTCEYIFITGHSRGCNMQNCIRFEAGPRMRVRKSLYGNKKVIGPVKTAETGFTRLDKRAPSVCACGEWLDVWLKEYSIRKFAKAAGFSYDRFNKARKVPGLILPDDLAEKITGKLGIPVADLRAAEKKYKEVHGERAGA